MSAGRTAGVQNDQLAELAEAERLVASLEEEQRTVDSRASEARRAGDAEGWMRCINRAEQLPDELRDARLKLLHMRLEAAWRTANSLFAAEEVLADALKDARTKHDDLAYKDPRRIYAVGLEAAEYQLEVAYRADLLKQADEKYQAAKHATGMALAHGEEIEEVITGMTGERPPEGEGLGALPSKLAADVCVCVQDPREGPGGVGMPAVALMGGVVPPRWAALRIDPGLFASAPATAAPAGDANDDPVRAAVTRTQAHLTAGAHGAHAAASGGAAKVTPAPGHLRSARGADRG